MLALFKLLKLVNKTVPMALERLGYSADDVKTVCDYIDENETIEGAPLLKDEHLAVFDCAFRPVSGSRCIQWMGHIRMMGAVQPFLSGAISKTVNLPSEASAEDVKAAYLYNFCKFIEWPGDVLSDDAEFIEIHNPTGAAVAMDDYHLTDAVYAPGSQFYWRIAEGDPSAIDVGEVSAWMRERLTPMKCPRSYEIVPDLLRNTMGKINKRKLRDAYARVPGAPLFRREFGYYCLEQWREQGMPQDVDLADLAELLGVTPAAVSQWESNTSRPSAKLWRRIARAEALGADFEVLQVDVDTGSGKGTEAAAREARPGSSGGRCGRPHC